MDCCFFKEGPGGAAVSYYSRYKESDVIDPRNPEFTSRDYSDLVRRYGYSKFYTEHADITPFWPYGFRFDLQLAKSVYALSKYVTKYITKNLDPMYLSKFAVDKERCETHYNPFFIQLPKRVGLGCRHFDKYVSQILNGDSMSILVKDKHPEIDMVTHRPTGKNRVYRIGIPAIFIHKLFPSMCHQYPCFRLNIAIFKSLYGVLSSKLDTTLRLSGDLKLYNEVTDIVKSCRVVYDSIFYLDVAPMRRKERKKVDSYVAFYEHPICGESTTKHIRKLIKLLNDLRENLSFLPNYASYIDYQNLVQQFYDKKMSDIEFSQITYCKHSRLWDSINYVEKYMLSDTYCIECHAD